MLWCCVLLLPILVIANSGHCKLWKVHNLEIAKAIKQPQSQDYVGPARRKSDLTNDKGRVGIAVWCFVVRCFCF